MTGQASRAMSAALVFVAASALVGCMGAGGSASLDAGSATALCSVERDGILTAEPEAFSVPIEVMTSAVQTLHTNGMFWFGYNVMAAQGGDLNDYNAGDGFAMGVAFGNENVKQFFELHYEDSSSHLIYDGSDVVGDARHRRFYAGSRRYLRPVTGQGGATVPFVVTGMTYNELTNSVDGSASTSAAARIDSARGVGVYVGTGLEIYLSSQVTLGVDMRGEYWNWEGKPAGTGENGTVSASTAIYYHF
jgi:hypothetical protein